MSFLNNTYEIPDDIFLSLNKQELTWKNLQLVPGDKFTVLEERTISRSPVSDDVVIGVTAIEVNGKTYFIEQESYATWCFFLERDMDCFIKLSYCKLL